MVGEIGADRPGALGHAIGARGHSHGHQKKQEPHDETETRLERTTVTNAQTIFYNRIFYNLRPVTDMSAVRLENSPATVQSRTRTYS